MNLFNFIQTGGFPMDVNVLDQMQTAYRLYNGLGALAGDIAIIKGCTLTGSTVSDGVVYINGEVLEFRTGIVAPNVIIVQEIQRKEFENGSTNEVHYTRYATFGVATVSYPWANFKRAFPTTEIQEALDQLESKTTVTALRNRIVILETKMATIATGAEVNVNTDWNATSGKAALLNKPAIGSPFLLKGTFSIGDVDGSDNIRTVTFQNVGTANYMIAGSFVSKGSNWDNDNDIFWVVREKTATSFKLCLREVSKDIQNIDFNYVIIPF